MIQRPDLRIILMSATLNAELFSQYFHSCPIINIPGENSHFYYLVNIHCFRALVLVFFFCLWNVSVFLCTSVLNGKKDGFNSGSKQRANYM